MEPGKVMFTEDDIGRRVEELGRRISEDYSGRNLLMVGVLKGAFIFLADLARHIETPLEFDFVALSSYGSGTSTSGVVRVLKGLDGDISGRDVLVVEDIIDSGLTLSYLVRDLNTRRPASLEICALLDKQMPDKMKIPVKYAGFTIPDVFVVGYGLDSGESYRNLRYIAALE